MKISYDKEVDALNIMFKKGRVERTEEISPEVFVDFGKSGDPLYIEIIGVSEKLGKANFNKIEVGKKSVHFLLGVS